MTEIAPILFLIFNRPDYTRRVFEEIRTVRPRRLYIAADGPRDGVGQDHIRVQEARDVLNAIDWDCEVKTLYRDRNLGCGRAISEAISWFFEDCDYGIILEDDCLPTRQFFKFSSKLLRDYEHDPRVFHVSGFSWIQSQDFDHPYYFMRYPNIWGWATWRDRWAKYTYDLDTSKAEIKQILQGLDISAEEHFYHKYTFDNVSRSLVDTWDYQWKYCVLKHRGLSISPNGSLVRNIGEESSRTGSRSLLDRGVPLIDLEDDLVRRDVALDLDMEALHREKYLLPKANYFYTLKSFKQKIKDHLTKHRALHKLLKRLRQIP